MENEWTVVEKGAVGTENVESGEPAKTTEKVETTEDIEHSNDSENPDDSDDKSEPPNDFPKGYRLYVALYYIVMLGDPIYHFALVVKDDEQTAILDPFERNGVRICKTNSDWEGDVCDQIIVLCDVMTLASDDDVANVVDIADSVPLDDKADEDIADYSWAWVEKVLKELAHNSLMPLSFPNSIYIALMDKAQKLKSYGFMSGRKVIEPFATPLDSEHKSTEASDSPVGSASAYSK